MIIPQPTIGTENISDSTQDRTSDLLTQEERRKIYREKLIEAQKGRGVRLKDFALDKRKYYRVLDADVRLKRAQDTDQMYRYLRGEQYGSYNTDGVYEDRRQDGDFAYTLPVLIGHYEQAFLQLLKTRPEYKYEPDDADDNTLRHVAEMCEILARKDLKRLMKGMAHDELHNILSAGESYRNVYQAPHPKAPLKAKRIKYRKVKVADTKDGEAFRQEVDAIMEVKLSENRIHIPHPLSMQRDMNATTWDATTFLIERTLINKSAAQQKYQCIIEDSGTAGMSPEMQMMANTQRSSAQTDSIVGSATGFSGPGRPLFGGEGLSHLGHFVEQERHFWDVEEYGWFYFDQDEILPDGTVIPEGTIWGEYHPNGIKLFFVGESILDISDCQWRKRWTIVQYGKLAGTNAGAGLQKLMPLQDVINDDFNLGQSVKDTVGHPLTAIDGTAISELPGAGQLLKITKAGMDDINKTIKQFPGQRMADDGTQERAQGVMQFVGGTSTVGNGPAGAPDMRAAATATGILAMQEQAAGRQAGPQEQRQFADEETMFQLLEAIQENWTQEKSPEMFADLVKRFGEEVVDAFFKCNLRQSLSMVIATGTDLPKSMAMTAANHMAMGEAISAIAPVLQQFPAGADYLQSFAEAMGFPPSIGQGRNDRREAEYRLGKLAMIEVSILAKRPQLAGNPDVLGNMLYKGLAKICEPLITPLPEDVEADSPRVFMQDHEVFKDVYKDAYFGTKSHTWSAARRMCVLHLWMDHNEAGMMKQNFEAALMGVLQQQMAPPAPPETGPSPEDVAAQGQQQQQHELTAGEIDHQRQQEAAQQQHLREQEAADADLHRGMIKDAHASQLQSQLLKSQPATPAKK